MMPHKLILIPVLIVCFGLAPLAQAVVPAPVGGYPGYNTATGQNALAPAAPGVWNTAIGGFTLANSVPGGNGNTAVGLNAARNNTTGDYNTATGLNALFRNTIGNNNTANGAYALFNNTGAGANTAIGDHALFSNTSGDYNTATGLQSLFSNSTGDFNTATGLNALYSNNTGNNNTANGESALFSNTSGYINTAVGDDALFYNTEGFGNTAVGHAALSSNTTGSTNTVLGFIAGGNITGDGNVCIGSFQVGAAGVNHTTWIGNVYGSNASARAVYVNSDSKIGTLSSSRRYKDEIRPMEKASEAILSLRPVSFRYKKEVDPMRSLSFGLIAEEVAEVDPDLVTPNRDGKPETVRYEAVNAMLLNEFLKEHRKVEQLTKNFESKLAQQQKQIDALTEGLQKVSAQLEASRPAPQMVLNDQ